MLDFNHLPTWTGNADIQVFVGTSNAEGGDWVTWEKPRGKSMVDIWLVGKGADGGTGVVAAGAGGGAGGGSGGQTRVQMPLALLPDTLYLSLKGQDGGSQTRSFIALSPRLAAGPGVPVVNDTLVMAYGGSIGGNATTTTGGTGGIAGAIATVGLMPLGWGFTMKESTLAGQAGTNGGSGLTAGTVGSALTLPITGLLVTGGTGGGGSPTTPGVGLAGGLITGAGMFPTLAGGVGGGAATTPPTNGAGGYYPIPKLMYGYGGTGGGGTYDVATGAGLVQSSGGHGMPGCGGGGMGGAYTGSSVGVVGKGGPSFCVITCW